MKIVPSFKAFIFHFHLSFYLQLILFADSYFIQAYETSRDSYLIIVLLSMHTAVSVEIIDA